MPTINSIPLSEFYFEYPGEEMTQRAEQFYTEMQRRRSIRNFSSRPVPRSVIEECLRTAGIAPSGANLQPWQFIVVSDVGIKKQIREAAEKEEAEFYQSRAPQEWLDALAALGTAPEKPFLEAAPYLIAIFAQTYRLLPDSVKQKNYYVNESVGIATGFLIAALHHAGLATLTHTPSPMAFLSRILHRPANERPYLLLVVGFPESDATVPVINKKTLEEYTSFL